mmetsp:Transcript_27681/g.54334  ORF Transcript_27681/g.54334 Transcript_27681/m.54334 type:complete len:298 (-) Transcript_27681:257-1150(-)|eukprot:CAMPEP_0172726916 /NCGR_PEP_ID=MMETSP1074-20121228/91382_1 /TAXON_ID=2916 /ORGANISM="Ceratium fusus, Strain PA161109" /LENGTH=297 /DNA_ID=CAMNT_0013554017 /DNA_START=49 /DNA_END=942 /DNA_ORIENTATION=+
MSCLSPDALSHFEQREQELLARNQQLDSKKAQVLTQVTNAVRSAESASLHEKVFHQPQDGRMSAQASSVLPPEQPQCSERAHHGVPVSEGSEALHATITFQNAKIIALQEELERVKVLLSSHEQESRQLREEIKSSSEANTRLHKSSGSNEQAAERLKKQLAVAEANCSEMERERADLLKVKDKFDVYVKKSDAEVSMKEARINRLLEERDKLKARLKELSSTDRDRVASDRKDVDKLTAEVRKLERQRTELIEAFKKQMKLIEVLKRQRVHMEAARVLSFTEDEFIRILELGDKLE